MFKAVFFTVVMVLMVNGAAFAGHPWNPHRVPEWREPWDYRGYDRSGREEKAAEVQIDINIEYNVEAPFDYTGPIEGSGNWSAMDEYGIDFLNNENTNLYKEVHQ